MKSTESTQHDVERILIDGAEVPFAAAGLIAMPGDFELRFRTTGYVPPATAIYEIETTSGRVYRGEGIDPSPNPWDHTIVHGQGETGFVE